MEIHIPGKAVLHEFNGPKIIWHFASADSVHINSYHHENQFCTMDYETEAFKVI